jgi:hypothetical protein
MKRPDTCTTGIHQLRMPTGSGEVTLQRWGQMQAGIKWSGALLTYAGRDHGGKSGKSSQENRATNQL